VVWTKSGEHGFFLIYPHVQVQ